MQSLKRAIRWDEERFGLELDLDRFMIVASNDFNLGAMENKGLNIFNARYVLASPEIATDDDYAGIEAIVGHEYFHNWTGNRVTCRDWFQLSLKEGLTVFREQEFVADGLPDAASRALRRIDDVRTLRATQFPEDAGPMAHPVRPDSYQEIANFYTATVYEKGAEVVRMLHTLLGEEGFRRGLDLYFERHDGKAVTCDDFVAALADANGRDLSQFSRWYAQAGTPRVSVASSFDAGARTFALTLTQCCPPTPGQPDKEPFHIPFALGLVGADGRDLPLRLDGASAAAATTRVLELTQPSQTFRFSAVDAPPVPSLARGLSAPIIVDYPYSDAELQFLARHDSDPFNRWEAGQRLACTRLMATIDVCETERPLVLDAALAELYAALLDDAALAPAFTAQALQLPMESFLAEQRAMVDPTAVRAARQFVRGAIGREFAPRWRALYAQFAARAPYRPDPVSAGRRALRNLALAFLVDSGAADALDLARTQLDAADNLTDRLAALTAIVSSAAPFKADVLVQCARDWGDAPLLMNKWFHVQATAIAQPGEVPVLARVRVLLKHPAFSIGNPNNVYALVLAFCAHNPAEFHREDGSGYEFWVEQVLRLDRINPTVAARVARTLERWRRFTPARGRLMRDALLAVAGEKAISRDVREIVTKALAG
jgi:aminopeptidase N